MLRVALFKQKCLFYPSDTSIFSNMSFFSSWTIFKIFKLEGIFRVLKTVLNSRYFTINYTVYIKWL